MSIPAVLYHYTQDLHLSSIFRADALWPAPPLRLYGLDRQQVESDPSRFGFEVRKFRGRRLFLNRAIPHLDCPGALAAATWVEGQKFDVALTRADWCYSVMSYFPEDAQEGGAFWRLVIDTAGLDLAGWQEYDRRANVPAANRRSLGESSRQVGDDPGDWYFFFGTLPLAGRLIEFEQFHRGRWTRAAEIFERAPLAELPWQRLLFQATFARTGKAAGLLGASLFGGVFLDGRLVADHVWVQQTWPHLRPGDHCRFFATIIPYRRRDSTVGWTLGDVNGLEVL